jgi:hypothetical protein
MTNDTVVNTQDPVMMRNLRKLFDDCRDTPSDSVSVMPVDKCYRCGDTDSWWEPDFVEVDEHRVICRECVKVAMDNIENEKQEIVDAIIIDTFREREPDELTKFVSFHGGVTTSNRRKMGVLDNIR